MKKIGISVYPDFDSIETIKEEVDFVKSLGYKVVFTSIQLGDLGFENTKIGMNEKFQFLFDYCNEIGLEVHVDINNRMLSYLGGSPDNLKPIHDMHVKVIRLDDGFQNHEIAEMTKNPYGILLEENASMMHFPKKRIETIIKEGDVRQYYACHNYFPLNETGLTFKDTLESARLFKQYGIKVGVFIGSLYSSTELNKVGRGIMTVEQHRYKPSHVQAQEFFVHDEFDYVVFGDSHPSKEELIKVSEAAKREDLSYLKEHYDFSALLGTIDPMYCVEIPIWFDKNMDSQIKDILTNMVFVARPDQADLMIRGTQTRGLCGCEPYMTIERKAYSIVMDNAHANRYNGEVQIPLVDMPAVHYANVIGQVKPYGYELLNAIKYANAMFVLKEE